mgnify:FL=1
MAKIVIVENDRDIAPLVEKLLELEGHKPILVADPLRAVDTVVREKPDLVYLDVRLVPQMDGFMVLRQIRSKMQVPVLMCSGLDVELKCLAAGANAFLLKPFDFQDLIEAVKRALKGKGVNQ